MQHPDDGMIHTWLDGELPADEAAALEAHVAECEQCRVLVAEAHGFIAASSRIVAALDNVPGGVIPVAKTLKRKWYSSPQFRAAAAVLAVAGASLLVVRTGSQKPTLAVSSSQDAREAATMQRPMSASARAALADSAALNSTVVADQAASKVETPKSAATVPPKSIAVLRAPVRESDAARIAPRESRVANEADFSGKGVKGGTANGVAGTALSGKVAGVAMKAADEMSPVADRRMAKTDLKVIRVDSTVTTKKTTYQSLSGSEVVLTEEELTPELSEAIVTAVAKERRQQALQAPPASPPPVAKASATPAPAPPAQSTAPIQTIRWMDLATRKRYALSGPVSVEELEAIKTRLLQAKR